MPAELSESDCLEALPEIGWIEDPQIRRGVVAVWQQTGREMAWDSLAEVPKNLLSEADRSLIGHIRGVTRLALSIADSVRESQGKPYDRDVLLAACLLHDVSKTLESEPAEGSGIGEYGVRPGAKSRIGRNMPHASYGAHLALNAGLSLEIANLIITHTHKSNVRGATWEAAILFYADYAETDAALFTFGKRTFLSRWLME